MTLLPEDTAFTTVVTTDGFQCNEMKEGRPWTYQVNTSIWFFMRLEWFCYFCLLQSLLEVVKFQIYYHQHLFVSSQTILHRQSNLYNVTNK